MKVISTQEYFKKSSDELLQVDDPENNSVTLEEELVYNLGVFSEFGFDDINEYNEGKDELDEWVAEKYPEAKLELLLEMINGRIAAVYS